MKPTHTVTFAKVVGTGPDVKADTKWPTIGVAWLDVNTGKITLSIDSMPINFDGRLFLWPITDKPRENR